ncbi:formyl transferase [Gorgonomyces haynaldii]|nr:formyl transferase [Gorgonomyces haynaldii]
MLFKRTIHNILFFGSDAFSIASLEAILNQPHLFKSIAVVTPPVQKWEPEKSLLNRYCIERGIRVQEAPKRTLNGWTHSFQQDFDLAIAVSFGYFLPGALLDQFKRSLNVHPSLLPKYRGSSPIQYTILNKDDRTGTSIIELSRDAFDQGKILRQTEFEIPQDLYYSQLLQIVKEDGADNLVTVLSDLETFSKHAQVQDETNVTKAPKIKKEMARVDWNESMDSIYTKHRAIGEMFPLYCEFRTKRIQLLDLKPSTLSKEGSLGSIHVDRKENVLYCRCADGWLGVHRLQVEGKKPVKPLDFSNGYQLGASDCFA